MAYLPTVRRTPAQLAADNLANGVGTSGVIEGNTGAAGDAATPKEPAVNTTPGSGFINLDNYLKGNEGEGGRMVTATTAGLSKEADDVGAAGSKIVTDSAGAFKDAGGGKAAAEITRALGTDASGVVKAGTEFLNAGYAGPTADSTGWTGYASGAEDVNKRLGKLNEADTQVANLGTTYKGNGAYGGGFSMLDQFLMQGDKSGQDATAAVMGKSKGVDAAVGATKASLDTAETDAKKALEANKQGVRGAAKTQLNTMVTDGTTRVADMNTGLDHVNYDGVVDYSAGDGYDDTQLADLRALAAISGTAEDVAWGTRTGNQGTRKALVTDEGSVGGAPPPGEPKTKEQIISDVTGINSWQDAAKTAGYAPHKPVDKVVTVAAEKIEQERVEAEQAALAHAEEMATQARENTGIPEWVVPTPYVPTIPQLKDPRKKWCLAAGTQILMADGSQKSIQYLNVGDELAFGGAVTSISPVISYDLFEHNGVLVAEGHAVFNNGAWTRIGEVGSRRMGSSVVYPVNCVNHVIVTNNTVFADYQEVEGVEGDEDCLAALNNEASVANANSITSQLLASDRKRA